MKYTEANQGRIFVLRLEDQEILQSSIETFVLGKNIQRAIVQVLGGADKGSKIIVGPENGRGGPIVPMVHVLDEMNEIVGTGTVFPNANGEPKLHLHISCGRQKQTISGDVRAGVIVWHVVEVVIIELLGSQAIRNLDRNTGFSLLMSDS